jgi:aldehyde:ferredoxin oxidoreductase
MMYGNMGKILFVDLSTGKITVETPDESLYRRFIGGYGVGVKILYDRQKPGADPLGPGNYLGFTTGPAVGIKGLWGTRFMTVGKSPLTGSWGDANGGGYFGPTLKFAGFDDVFVHGVSAKPVFLLINDGKAELRDASHLWGKGVMETEAALKAEFGKKAAVACIGPGGEKLVLFSAVMHDTGCAAARNGLGAVMGSKKLKAVVAVGTGEVPVADKKKVAEFNKELVGMLEGDMYETFHKYGTPGTLDASAQNGDSPVKNWAGSGPDDFPNSVNIGFVHVMERQEKRHACLWCPIACKGLMKAGKDYDYPAGVHKPEYETLASFGTMLLNDDVESIIQANNLCNDYGVDTISAGAIVAFAAECYEHGILTKKETGGIDLTWGNSRGFVALLEKMVRREGIGDVLANGVKRAAKAFGKGAEQYAIHAGGQELAMHDPRFMETMAPTFCGDPAPGRHTSSSGLAPLTPLFRLVDLSGLCLMHFVSTSMGLPFDKLISVATGWDMSSDEANLAGERVNVMRQAFAVREGFKPSDWDISSGRPIGKPPLEKGPVAGVTVDAVGLRTQNYLMWDWDPETGKPSKQKLLELGLDDVAADLWPE